MLPEPHIKTLLIRSTSSLTGSASSLPRSAGSESYKAGSATISPDLHPTRLDLLLALQIYTGSDNISSDLQSPRLDLMLSLQIYARSDNNSSDLQSPKLDLVLYLQICTIQTQICKYLLRSTLSKAGSINMPSDLQPSLQNWTASSLRG